MNKWIIAALSLAALALVLYLTTKLALYISRTRLGKHGLTKKKLLTANELDFYRKLLAAVSPRWTVLVQVSMGALIDTKLKAAHPQYWDVRSQFSQKICDFVLCDPKTLEPVLIVELDDVMHDFDKDQARDTVAARAGYQTLRFWSRKKPTVLELKQHIENELALNSAITLG